MSLLPLTVPLRVNPHTATADTTIELPRRFTATHSGRFAVARAFLDDPRPIGDPQRASSRGRNAPVRRREENAMTRDGRLVLSVTEAAGMLGISRGLAYELVARGELPSLRLGRRIVVPRRALEALLDAAVEEPVDPVA
jgi:excisionase family DNA binding protein